jgi:hypothetical protein
VIDPVPPDIEHTTVKLARALREVPKPGVPAEMIDRAEAGYYHDYLSPLAMPELALFGELLALARHPSRNGTESRKVLLRMIEAVMNSEYEASHAESQAWAKSTEGRSAFLSLLKERPR